MLYLVATPIGNLGDLSPRAQEILGESDLILCEDTRHSLPLLRHFSISTPLQSYHKFNEAERETQILERLKAGDSIALISDAGTPAIADPGQRLVRQCHEEGLPVVSIPGPSAPIVALSASGAQSERFQMVGFLPKKVGELRLLLFESLTYPGTTICFESPHRLERTLELLNELAPSRPICVARELTKRYEEVVWALPRTHLKQTYKGEIVLLIEGSPSLPEEWLALSPTDHVRLLEETYGLNRNEAIKAAALLRGVPKRSIYRDVQE